MLKTTDSKLSASGVARQTESSPLHRQIFNELHTETSSEEDSEDDEDFNDMTAYDDLDDEEKELQRVILRNFLGRTK